MVAAFSWSSLKSATILFSTVWRVADGVLPDHGRIRLHFRGLDVDGGGWCWTPDALAPRGDLRESGGLSSSRFGHLGTKEDKRLKQRIKRKTRVENRGEIISKQRRIH